MFRKRSLTRAVSTALGLAVTSVLPVTASAQDDMMLEEVIVTGSRISAPGVVSSSPIASIDSSEFKFQQSPSFEFVMRALPSTIPGDGSAVNNGTAGQSTIDLRGLGPERNLVLMVLGEDRSDRGAAVVYALRYRGFSNGPRNA